MYLILTILTYSDFLVCFTVAMSNKNLLSFFFLNNNKKRANWIPLSTQAWNESSQLRTRSSQTSGLANYPQQEDPYMSLTSSSYHSVELEHGPNLKYLIPLVLHKFLVLWPMLTSTRPWCLLASICPHSCCDSCSAPHDKPLIFVYETVIAK